MTAPALYDLVSSRVRGQVVSQIATSLGEDLYPAKAGVAGAVPVILTAAVRRTSTVRGAAEILGLLRAHRLDGTGERDSLAAIIDAEDVYRLVETGRPLLAFLLEARLPAVTKWLAARAAVRIASAGCILGLATPVVLGAIGTEVRARGWNDHTLRDLMRAQQTLLPDPPAGLEEALGPEVEQVSVTAIHLRKPWWRRALSFGRL